MKKIYKAIFSARFLDSTGMPYTEESSAVVIAGSKFQAISLLRARQRDLEIKSVTIIGDANGNLTCEIVAGDFGI